MCSAAATVDAAPPQRGVVSSPRLFGNGGASGGEQLRLMNSLTQQVEPFVPIDPRLVKWYVCGPTVYDASHVGHARNYVAFDVVRRVLMDYFGFDVLYVMNITDIDDKIILRTHLNHLISMVAAVEAHAAEGAPPKDELASALASAQATLALPKPGLPELLAAQRDLAAAATGVSACDVQAAFLELTAAYEADFFDDMERLNVLPPDAVTRVSDYVPEVIEYIQTIASNGYCYEANGSVYFDTAAFSSAESKTYGKLDPSKVAAGQGADATDWTEGKSAAELLAEGEGSLSADTESEKKQAADFVLWKASKEGEPAWDSPWGSGRPGWHIECSAMASDLLGEKVDLNAGGVDLKFPHHENQIAQCEAFFDCCAGDSWVNYFLHSGHLQIEGLKMSKSLKNFITIKGALQAYSPSQVRFLFLLRRFSEPMEYSENTLTAAADLERRFAAFSASLSTRLREASEATSAPSAAAPSAADPADAAAPTPPSKTGLELPAMPARIPTHKWGAAERTLQAAFVEKRQLVHSALCDSIDTPSALKALEQLVRATNVYMGEVPDVAQGGTLLGSIHSYFAKVMGSFGLTTFANGGVGAGGAAGGGAGGGAGDGTASAEAVARALSAFRDEVRAQAIASVRGTADAEADGALDKRLLQLCDELRDGVLPPLGIQLDDRSSGAAQLQMGDPRVLMAEQARKAEAAAKAAADKAAKAAAKAAEAERVAARSRIPPEDIFRPEHDAAFERAESFSDLDADGLPQADAAGEPLSKSQRKKLVKARDKHAKAYAKAAAEA